jgi:membrane protein implicated in regulation of membrane protease activity
MSWWIWVLIGFGILALELTAATLHVGFFAVGAIVVAALVAAGVDLPLWAQLVIFTVVSLIAFFFLRPVLVRKLKLDQKKVVDSLVGEQAIALEDMSAGGGNGRAEMRGSTWGARNVGETALLRGQRCTVAAVDGLVIHVRAS